MINKKILLFAVMFLLSIGLVVGFTDDFESYLTGQVDSVTTFWNCSSFGDSHCQIVNHTSLEGGKALRITNLIGSDFNVFSDNAFPSVSSGVVNYWVKVNASGVLDPFNSASYSVGVYNSSPPSGSPSNENLAVIRYSALSSSTTILVFNGTTSTSWIHGSGQSFVELNNNPFYWRIRVDFDSGELEYFQYDDNLTLRSQHDAIVTIPSNAQINLLSQGVDGNNHNFIFFFDDIQLLTGNIPPVASNILLTPANPSFSDVLSCTFSFTDVDNDADESKIVWKVNNIPQTFYENNTFLAGGVANPSDTVKCEVTAFDGILEGNIISDSVNVQGVVGAEADITNFTMELKDFEVLDLQLITAMDYFDEPQVFFEALNFAGFNSTDFVVGIVDLFNPLNSNVNRLRVTEFGYTAGLSAYNNGFWTASDGGVQRWNGAVNSLSLLSISPDNFTSSGEIYLDIKAVNQTVALACLEFAGSESLATFEYNGTAIEDKDIFPVPACRDIEYSDGLAYVDMGSDGLGVFNVTNLTSIVSVRNHSTRTTYSIGVRHDTIDLSSSALWIDAGEDYGFEYTKSELATNDLPFINGICEISEEDNDGVFLASEIVDDDLLVFSNFLDGDLYVCDYAEQNVVKVHENTFGSILGFDLISWTEGNLNYVYTSFDNTIQLFLLTTFDQSVNQLPEFVDSTPDNEYIDNFNPIATNVTPAGLETPVVQMFPLTCNNPNIFECSTDFEGDTILFAVDKDNDGDLDLGFTSVENVFVTYDTGGLKTLRIYITDDQHLNNLETFRDFTIDVSASPVVIPAGQGLLKFLVKDAVTDLVLSGVSVSIDNSTAGFTNGQGEFTTVENEDVYLVDFSKNNYITKANFFSTSPIIREVFLEPVLASNKRTLTVIVKDINNTPLPTIFVNLFMPITQSFDFKVTDALGTVTFTSPEDNVVVTIEKNGFSTVEETLSVPLGTQKIVEVILEKSKNVSRGSTCIDYLAGVITCGEQNKTCTQDSDCINDLCNPSSNTCSNFNWTLCDDSGLDRGQRCVIKYTSGGVLNAVGQWLLSNFFFVLIMVFLALAVLIFALSRK